MKDPVLDVAKIQRLDAAMTSSGSLNIYHKNIGSQVPGPDISKININQFIKAYTHMGDTTTGVTDVLRGITSGLTGIPSGVAKTANFKSKIFVVRPQLNLSSENLGQDRHLADLLSNVPNSMANYVRMMLDPRLGTIQGDRYTGNGGGSSPRKLSSKLVDNECPFIPVLTNTYESISGWPESVAKTHTSSPGMIGEETIMVDGRMEFRGRFELDIAFKKIRTDPIIKMFNIWLKYPGLGYMGTIYPYFDFIRADEYDYNTRIYQLLLSEDGKYVKKIASTGVSIPISLPDGGEFNIGSDDGPFEGLDDTHVIRFASVGALYNDPVSILNFNKVSTYFSMDMKMLNQGSTNHNLEPVSDQFKELYSNWSYPRINLHTLELEWWIDKGKASQLRSSADSSNDRIITRREKVALAPDVGSAATLAGFRSSSNGGYTKYPTGTSTLSK